MSTKKRKLKQEEEEFTAPIPHPLPPRDTADPPPVPTPNPDDAVQYHCDYCRKDISHGIRIKCAACTDFDLCVECFSVGVEVTPHQNDHPYQVMDRVNFPLFALDWDAEEELLLLEAIAKYGLGNWEDVAEHVGTKTLDDCRSHYFSTYIESSTAPLPDTSHVLTTPATLQQRKLDSDVRHAEQKAGGLVKKQRKAGRPPKNAGGSSSKTLPGQAPIGVPGGSAGSSAAGNNSYASAPVSLEMAGFMPLRREFEVEYHNDAEALISPLTFEDDDTADETEAKYRLLELYHRKLLERYQRRDFAISRQLMNTKRLFHREREVGREDRDFYARLRVFLQVLSKEDFDRFVDSMVAERRLRRRIEALQHWRQAGCRTVVSGERFASEAKRRASESRSGQRARREAASAAAASVANERRKRLEALAKWNQKVPKARKSQRLVIDHLPGASLLTDGEQELCSELRLYPKQYLLVKDTILQLSQQSPVLKKTHVRGHVQIDVNKTGRVFEFMEQCGWINNHTALARAQMEAQKRLANQ